MRDSTSHPLWNAIAFITAYFLLVVGSTNVQAVMITTDIVITGTINGEQIAGLGTSSSDTSTGISITEITFSALPNNFDPPAYGKSWKTKHHKKIALSTGGTENFLTLSPSGYSFSTTIEYDGGLGTLLNTGSVVPIGVNHDLYTMDISGTYLGPSTSVVGIDTEVAIFTNVVGSPGDILMTDREIIDFGGGVTLGLTEVGTFTLFSGETLPVEPDGMTVDVLAFGFDSVTNTLTLDTLAKESPVPEPSTLILLILSLSIALTQRRIRSIKKHINSTLSFGTPYTA